MSSIASDQSKHGNPQNFQVNDAFFILSTGQMWIPQEAINFQSHHFVIAHASAGDNSGQSSTVSTLANRLHCKHLNQTLNYSLSAALIVSPPIAMKEYYDRLGRLCSAQNRNT